MAIMGPHAGKQSGFSLVEVMIAMTIGLVVLMAIISMLITTTRSQRNLDQASNIVENGYFSINTLYDELRHAGFYGHYFANNQAIPALLPDPCTTNDATALQNAMALPIQGYDAVDLVTHANVTGTLCATLLANTNLQPGSDILVIRRANTSILTGTPITNEIYLQSNVLSASIQFGDPSANVPTTTADNLAPTLMQRNGAILSAADIRKYHVGIYFVAPCSVGNGANGVCTATDDTIPTLKRMELTVEGGVPAMVITPLAEGVEYMELLYGIDTTPATSNAMTGLIGDGIPDTYITAPTLAQWSSVTSVQIHLLIRSTAPTTDYVDDKSFQLATLSVPAANDNFKRHIFNSEVRLINLAGPRSLL